VRSGVLLAPFSKGGARHDRQSLPSPQTKLPRRACLAEPIQRARRTPPNLETLRLPHSRLGNLRPHIFPQNRPGRLIGELAHEWARVVQVAGSWDAQAVPKTPPPDAPVAPARIIIADAIKVYLGNRETANIAPATLRTYRTFTKKLQAAIVAATSCSTVHRDGHGRVLQRQHLGNSRQGQDA